MYCVTQDILHGFNLVQEAYLIASADMHASDLTCLVCYAGNVTVASRMKTLDLPLQCSCSSLQVGIKYICHVLHDVKLAHILLYVAIHHMHKTDNITVSSEFRAKLIKNKCFILCHIPQTLQCLSWPQKKSKVKQLHVFVQTSQLVHIFCIKPNLLSFKILDEMLLL